MFAVDRDTQPRLFWNGNQSVDGVDPLGDDVIPPGLGVTVSVPGGGLEGGVHVGRHRPCDLTADILEHEGQVEFAKETGLANRGPNLGVPQHVPVRGPSNHLERRTQRRVVVEDRNTDPVAKLLVGVDVLLELRIFKGPANREPGHPDQQVGSVIVGATHGDIELDLEPRWSDLLHRLELVEDVLEGREMVFQPGVTPSRVLSDGFGHVGGVGRDSPRTDLDPTTLPLTDQPVNRNTRSLAHQVVHRRPQSQRCHVTDMIERVGPDVALADTFGLQRTAFSEPHQPGIGLHLIDIPFRGPVEMLQFVVDPLVVTRLNLVGLDRLDADRPSRLRLGPASGGQSMPVSRQHRHGGGGRTADGRQESSTVDRPGSAAVEIIKKMGQQ